MEPLRCFCLFCWCSAQPNSWPGLTWGSGFPVGIGCNWVAIEEEVELLRWRRENTVPRVAKLGLLFETLSWDFRRCPIGRMATKTFCYDSYKIMRFQRWLVYVGISSSSCQCCNCPQLNRGTCPTPSKKKSGPVPKSVAKLQLIHIP